MNASLLVVPANPLAGNNELSGVAAPDTREPIAAVTQPGLVRRGLARLLEAAIGTVSVWPEVADRERYARQDRAARGGEWQQLEEIFVAEHAHPDMRPASRTASAI